MISLALSLSPPSLSLPLSLRADEEAAVAAIERERYMTLEASLQAKGDGKKKKKKKKVPSALHDGIHLSTLCFQTKAGHATEFWPHGFTTDEGFLTYRGGGIPRGDFSAGKIPYFILVRNVPLTFRGEVRNFPVRNFVHVSHRTTVCLVLRRALPVVLFPLFCSCCQPTGKGGQEVE